MIYVTHDELRKHTEGNWRRKHNIWKHLKEYVPGWGYSKAEIDAMWEGYSGTKGQIAWANVTGKPGTFPPSAHTLASHSTKAHSELTGVSSDQHHAKVHNILSDAAHGDVLAASRVRGDILVANATPKWARLAKGAAATFLRSNGTDPSWGALLAADLPVHKTRHQAGGADFIRLDDLAEPEANIDLNVSPSRHGLFPVLSGHPAECYVGDGAWLRLYDSTSIVIKILSKGGTIVRHSNDGSESTSSSSYTKIKEVKIGEVTGNMRVYFEMRSTGAWPEYPGYAQIWKNGVPIGLERERGQDTWQGFEELIDPCAPQDLIQIYAKTTGNQYTHAQYMRFKYDRSINMLGDHVLSTPIEIVWQEGDEIVMQNQDP